MSRCIVKAGSIGTLNRYYDREGISISTYTLPDTSWYMNHNMVTDKAYSE